MPMYPKLLPWLAKRAGVKSEVAEKLWRRSLGDACDMADRTQSHEVHRLAIERFIDLLEAETDGTAITPSPYGSWYWRHQRRLATQSFRTVNLGWAVWEDVWARLTTSASDRPAPKKGSTSSTGHH